MKQTLKWKHSKIETNSKTETDSKMETDSKIKTDSKCETNSETEMGSKIVTDYEEDTYTEQNKESGSILNGDTDRGTCDKSEELMNIVNNDTDPVTSNKSELMDTQCESESETKEMIKEKLITDTDSKIDDEKDTPEQNSEKLENMEHNDIDTAVSTKCGLNSEMNTCDGKSETKDNETEIKLPYNEESQIGHLRMHFRVRILATFALHPLIKNARLSS